MQFANMVLLCLVFDFYGIGCWTAKDYQRAVKCFFICTESLADVDIDDPNFKYFTRIEAARCHIMHIHTVPTLPKFASR